LNLQRPLFIFDLETTGVVPMHARIVEIGFEMYTSAGLQKEWSCILNPGIPIPADSTAVHHLDDDSVKDRPTFAQVGPNVALGFRDCDYAGKNIRFDLQILKAEMDRAKIPWSYEGAFVIDAERLEQICVPRTLSHLYEKYTGEKLEGAHGALQDVMASRVVLAAQLKKNHFPRDLRALHELQWPGWVDSEGKFRTDKKGVITCRFGKYRDTPITSIPPSYWRFIIDSTFSQEIKTIAKNALSGQYPKGVFDER
jgi:DNA polymerase-3 subunit epsilon